MYVNDLHIEICIFSVNLSKFFMPRKRACSLQHSSSVRSSGSLSKTTRAHVGTLTTFCDIATIRTYWTQSRNSDDSTRQMGYNKSLWHTRRSDHVPRKGEHCLTQTEHNVKGLSINFDMSTKHSGIECHTYPPPPHIPEKFNNLKTVYMNTYNIYIQKYKTRRI